MELLHEIQVAILKENSDLGPVLLKLQLLAARLGSQPLAEWIKHESEGYPRDAELPDYRRLGVSYSGTFSGPFGSGIQNAPISSFLIEQFAGGEWVRYEMRESIASVDDLLAQSASGGSLQINAADLILLLQGKIYPDYACNAVVGAISRSSLAAIRHTVRSRLLELTIELEKSVPEASKVSLGHAEQPSAKLSAATTQITQQIIYGNLTSVTSSGESTRIAISIGERDSKGLASYLIESGFPEDDAKEIARLASSEEPESRAEPMGPRVREWLAENLMKAATGVWKIGLSVATEVTKEALLRYYGLK